MKTTDDYFCLRCPDEDKQLRQKLQRILDRNPGMKKGAMVRKLLLQGIAMTEANEMTNGVSG